MNWKLLLGALIAVAGCAETRPDAATSRQPLTTVTPAVSPATAAANAAERASKAAGIDRSPQGPVAQAVDWDEARGFKQLDRALLPVDQQPKLDDVTVPVLAFDDATLLASALLTHHHNWYVVAVEYPDGLNMNVRGTRNAWTAPNMEIPEAARLAAENYTLSRTHGVVTVSWRAFGASYSLNVDCTTPVGDVRCTEDEFALGVVEQLGVIGGRP